MASGVIPQISAIMGPCAGGAVYSPALTDFIIMVKETSHMFITGPQVIKAVIGQEVSFEDLGGALVHSQTSGVAHFMADNEEGCIETIKRLLSYLPSNNMEDPPIVDTGDDPNRIDENIAEIIPADPDKPYDIRDIIACVADNGDFLEVHPLWAPNIVIGFARLNGRSIGIVANQPRFYAGALDINSSTKAGRFVRFCDTFNIPIVTFVDVPGFLPGIDQEHGGIIRHGSKLLYAYCEATVPKITLIVRKAYGGAYDVMGSKHSGGDINYAWPTAEIAVMGPQGAINIIFRKEITKFTALIRELHIYGSETAIGKKSTSAQHRSFGSLLLKEAERIAKEEFSKKEMIVISGIGARKYYFKRGYKQKGPYVHKKLR